MSMLRTFPKLRVLLADDEPFVRRLAAQTLRSLEIAALWEVSSGAEAIALLGEHAIDLLVTDIQMPDVNGIELIKRIRMGETPADRRTRIIVLTSFSDTEVLGACIALDVNGFLVKPFTMDGVRQKVDLALSEKVTLRSVETYRKVVSELAVLAEAEARAPVGAGADEQDDALGDGAQGEALRALHGLEPGMILLEDLYAKSGVKLITRGRVLTDGLINRIVELRSILENEEIRVRLHAK